MADVVTINGSAMAAPGQPDKDVVETLEELLEMARSGEIAGVAAATLHADGSSMFHLAGITGRYALVGALAAAQARLCDLVNHGN